MALVLVEGEEKVPGLLNTANVSVIAMTPQAINLEGKCRQSKSTSQRVMLHSASRLHNWLCSGFS